MVRPNVPETFMGVGDVRGSLDKVIYNFDSRIRKNPPLGSQREVYSLRQRTGEQYLVMVFNYQDGDPARGFNVAFIAAARADGIVAKLAGDFQEKTGIKLRDPPPNIQERGRLIRILFEGMENGTSPLPAFLDAIRRLRE